MHHVVNAGNDETYDICGGVLEKEASRGMHMRGMPASTWLPCLMFKKEPGKTRPSDLT
jgi:hypothetical protein